MTTIAINEDTYAERPALEWLEEVGWPVIEGKEIAPNSPGAERENYQEVILVDRLRGAVKELNPELRPGFRRPRRNRSPRSTTCAA